MRYFGCFCLAALLVVPRVVCGQFDATTPAADAKAGAADATQPASRTQTWEFGVAIRAVGGPCVGLLGTFPVPIEWPEQQVKVESEDITPHVQRHIYRESDGLKQMVFNVPQLPAGETAKCFVTFEITKRAQAPPAETAELVVPKEPPREVRKYLQPSPLIESSSAKARTLAKELTIDKAAAWDQVQSIVEGVRDRVKYEQENKSVFKGSAGALRDGKADKEDLTATFVALCRAAKIPARMVWAMDYCYAEFYLEDEEKKGAWYPCVVHERLELGEVKDLRPIIQKGDNFKVNEEPAPQRFVREHLKGKGGRPTVEFRRRRVD
jgi:hypothetical protein